MAWCIFPICTEDKKIKHPSELFKKGDVVEAKVLGINVDERFSLS